MTPDPALVYPEMRHLVMRCAESLPCTIAFVQAYPNLRCLSLSSWEGEDGWLPDGHTEQREINLRAQAAPGQSWGVLHEYSGSLSDLYVLGLVCCIERARLYNPVPGHIHLLDPVLSYARPRRLVFGHTLEGADTLLDVSAAIRGSGGSRLEDLTLPIELQSKDKAADVNGLMHALLSSLEHAPLGAIQLCIDTWHVDARPQRERVRDVPPPPLRPRSEDYPLNAAERSVNEFDVSEYVHRFAQRVRTLRRATVRVIGPRGRWREVTLLEGGEIRMEERISDSPWQ
ncbi:hypothetical protein BC628DRAFT_1423777 [Trametes gibbosa]|nr:hypothetical protein BC628DRAFT_1423777 [Trametes gibbosa]